MKIRPVGAELFRADGQTDRHDESNSRFSQFSWTPLKNSQLKLVIKMPVFEKLGNVDK
jgi:hypothetical protein